MKKTGNDIRTKTGIVLMLLVLALPVSVFAFPYRVWNHSFNPALLGSSNRGLLEVGMSADIGVGNSYFTAGSIFNDEQEILIDLNDMYESAENGGLRVNSNIGARSHAVVTLFGLSVGGYASVEGLTGTAVPQGLIGLLSEGIVIDQEITQDASGDAAELAFAELFSEFGVYGGFRLGDLTMGLKVGFYQPIAYGSGTTKFSYVVNSDGTINAEATATGSVYSGVDLQSPDQIVNTLTSGDPLDALLAISGSNLDIGFVYAPVRRLPSWGVSLSNIPLGPAQSEYGYEVTASASATVNPIATSFDDTDTEMVTFEVGDPEFSEIERKAIFMPLRLGGFYRFRIPFVDVTPFGEMVLSEARSRLNWGVTVEGNFFPINALSVGIARQELMWNSHIAARISIHIVEVAARISTASPDLLDMFATQGLAANVMVSMGL